MTERATPDASKPNVRQEPLAHNIFHSATTVEELLGQMVGAGSVCWENPSAAGVFMSEQARDIVQQGFSRLQELVATPLLADNRHQLAPWTPSEKGWERDPTDYDAKDKGRLEHSIGLDGKCAVCDKEPQ